MAATAKGKPGEEKKPRRRIKKVAGHGGHHGGAWKVAYADFVTAMMALFLVLWLLSQADTKLKEAIANYFRSPGAFNTVRGGILPGARTASKGKQTSLSDVDEEQSFLAAAMSLKNKFSTKPEFSSFKDQVRVDVTGEGLRVQIVDKADKVSFASGSAELNPMTQAILSEIARTICDLPNPIYIGGHTDKRPFARGNNYTNWELSADRANAARRALEANCVKPDQIRRVVGYADTEPLIPNDAYAAANRRISIIVLRVASKGADAKDDKKKAATEGENSKPESAAPDEQPEKKGSAASDEKPTAEKNGGKSGEKSADKSGDESSQKSKARARLKTEGKITVGEPDEIPASASRSRENKHQP
ncbi:MAG: flagellar motor protein MotB [Blastocatellia bacterium]